MAEIAQKQWYLAVGDRSIGPLTTELVARGIDSGKVPLTAWICQVGASSWSALSSFDEFQDVVDRVLARQIPANQQSSVAPPAYSVANSGEASSGDASSGEADDPATDASALGPDSQTLNSNRPASAEAAPPPAQHQPSGSLAGTPRFTEEQTGRRLILPYEIAGTEQLPSYAESTQQPDIETSVAVGHGNAVTDFDDQSGSRELTPEMRAGMSAYAAYAEGQDSVIAAQAGGAELDEPHAHDELGIDITFDEDHENAIDWTVRFQSYFLVGSEVELPEEERLLQSLAETPRSTFLHDEALWNLSLCLAFGSDDVALNSARTFFEAVGSDHGPERIEWICRTLLSKGFMPSGIPRSEGMRGIDVLRYTCPYELADVLEREAMD